MQAYSFSSGVCCARALLRASRAFSQCSLRFQATPALQQASSTSSSENSQQGYKPTPRFYDSLSDKKVSPKAQHAQLSDRSSFSSSSARFTIRSPSSPVPAGVQPIASTSTLSASVEHLPPPVHKQAPSYATLTAEQIAEMRALRLSDPETWSRSKLAAKYNVSPFFVSLQGFGDSTEAKSVARQVKAKHQLAEEKQRESWGFKKRVDREVRRRRKEFW